MLKLSMLKEECLYKKTKQKKTHYVIIFKVNFFWSKRKIKLNYACVNPPAKKKTQDINTLLKSLVAIKHWTFSLNHVFLKCK